MPFLSAVYYYDITRITCQEEEGEIAASAFVQRGSG